MFFRHLCNVHYDLLGCFRSQKEKDMQLLTNSINNDPDFNFKLQATSKKTQSTLQMFDYIILSELNLLKSLHIHKTLLSINATKWKCKK